MYRSLSWFRQQRKTALVRLVKEYDEDFDNDQASKEDLVQFLYNRNCSLYLQEESSTSESEVEGESRVVASDNWHSLVQIRIQRALDEKLCVLAWHENSRFEVLSSTGTKTYEVRIQEEPLCTCLDNQQWGSYHYCKHILLVLIRVFKIPLTSPLLFQTSLDANDLADIWLKPPAITKTTSNQPVSRHEIEGDCPICYEKMIENEDLVWCQRGCGHNLHAECWAQWRQHGSATCVLCRTRWF